MSNSGDLILGLIDVNRNVLLGAECVCVLGLMRTQQMSNAQMVTSKYDMLYDCHRSRMVDFSCSGPVQGNGMLTLLNTYSDENNPVNELLNITF